ncbi:MAG: redox-sensing transcriptional repressor Rex [Clostridia bacterium]|nr:redox-sensing transcriptional repressor Rex [Clostridia bacterium]
MNHFVSDAVIRRLPGYYRHLRELEAEGVSQISSKELGERMHQTPSQIRQDINCFGGFGRQGYGYHVPELKEQIRRILGLDREHTMIIIGAGSIGSAVAHYPNFVKEGFHTLALFDADKNRIGTTVNGIRVLDIHDLESFLSENIVDIAVLAVPVEAARDICDRLKACGIDAIWNFAPLDLEGENRRMTIVNVHLSDTLHILSYKMLHRETN